MAETVEVPGIGRVPKNYALAGGALLAGIALYALWSRRTAASSGSPGDYYADLRTGSDLEGSGDSGRIDTESPENENRAPRTNQEWAARVLEKLSWWEPAYVSSTVAKYLDRRPISAEGAGLIREAWAHVGQPPGGMIPIILGGADDDGQEPEEPADDPDPIRPTPRRPAPGAPAPSGERRRGRPANAE